MAAVAMPAVFFSCLPTLSPRPCMCAAGPPVNSRLGAIVTAYLRQQHRAACLTAAQPMSVVPPVSLLKPYSLPVATRPLNAPANVTLRLARQEVWGGFGGRGESLLPAQPLLKSVSASLKDAGVCLLAMQHSVCARCWRHE